MRIIIGGGVPSLIQAVQVLLSSCLHYISIQRSLFMLIHVFSSFFESFISYCIYMYNAFGSCWSVPGLGLCWFLYLFLVYKKDLWIIKGGLIIYCVFLFVMWRFLFLLFLFNGIQAGIQVIYLFFFSLGLQCYFHCFP